MGYVGNDVSVTVTGSIRRCIHCEKCGSDYSFIDEKTATSEAHSFFTLDDVGATRAAREGAEKKLRRLLDFEIGAVPCPQCGWYQSSMLPAVRRQLHRWMLGTAWDLFRRSLWIGLVFAILGKLVKAAFDTRDELWLVGFLVGCVGSVLLAVLLVVVRWCRCAFYDPNRAIPTEERIAIGRQFALAPESAASSAPPEEPRVHLPLDQKLPTQNITPLPKKCHELVGLEMFVVRSELSARVTGSAWKPTLCCNCGEKYYYRMTRTTTGTPRITGPTTLEEVQHVAQELAERRLWNVLAKDCDFVPCPTCGHYQPEMCEKLRERKGEAARKWNLIFIVIAGLCGTAIWLGFLSEEAKALGVNEIRIPLFLLGGTAGGIAIFRHQRALRQERAYNPNDDPLEDRLKIAKEIALTADELLRRWGTRHNADPSPEVPKPWKTGTPSPESEAKKPDEIR